MCFQRSNLQPYVLSRTDAEGRPTAAEGRPFYNRFQVHGSPSGRVKRVGERIGLIVDDDSGIRTYLRLVLYCRGMQTLEAGNAVEALRILGRLSGQIDLLITDVQMPGDMDGIELACSVQRSFSMLPIVLVSGRPDGRPTGFTVIQKPFTPDEILLAIDKSMQVAAARAPRELPSAGPRHF